MRTRIMRSLLLICCIAISITTYAQAGKEKKVDLKGTWDYAVPDAPYGYQNGTIEFKNDNEKLTAVAKIGSSSYTINDIIKKDDQYNCSLYVDGSDVKITFKPGTDKITGTAVAEGWEMPITLTPTKK